MTPTDLTRLAERVLAYVIDPPSGDDPVINHASPAELRARFADVLPLEIVDETGVGIDDLAAAVDLVIHHSMQTTHPRFLNQNWAGPDPISVVADFLGAALNTTAATFEVAPVFTVIESAVLHRLATMIGYPVGDEPVPALPPGIFCPGGSTATLYALQLARHRRDPDIIHRGIGAVRQLVFCSASAHYQALKSAALLGLGRDAVIKVADDHDGAIVPAALTTAIDDAFARGDEPLAVIATAGTTVTAAFDDLHALADICERHGIWLHVDGCYGGAAIFSDTTRHLLDGLERSDSFVLNLHKMMGATQQCTALLVRDPEQLEPCFGVQADYIFQPDKLHGEWDTGDRTFQCGRRPDALKLWLMWKAHGDEAFAARIDHAMAMAQYARDRIAASDGAFVPVVEGSFTNVVFVWVPPDLRPLDIATIDDTTRARLHALAPKIKARFQAEGTAMLGYQPIHGVNTFRLIFMNPAVAETDIDAALAHIDAYGRAAEPDT